MKLAVQLGRTQEKLSQQLVVSKLVLLFVMREGNFSHSVVLLVQVEYNPTHVHISNGALQGLLFKNGAPTGSIR